MAAYISSNDNRFYVALESTYGQAAAATANNRIPAVKLSVRQQCEKAARKDKTGTRTFLGDPSGLKRTTNFGLTTYLTGWDSTQAPEPSCGPLFRACMGAAQLWGGGTIVSVSNSTRITFAAQPNLAVGQAVSLNGEIRFVASLDADPQSVHLNAPFSAAVLPGSGATSTATYAPAPDLKSATIYDYWDPATAVQRFLCGAAVNAMKVSVNGDFHEFVFSGAAADVVDSISFQPNQGGLVTYPLEPGLQTYNYSPIPGHLGEVWLGGPAGTPNQFYTVTKAELSFSNNLQLRDQEFGSSLALGITPGIRNVSLNLTLFQQDDQNTQALYYAARQRNPISVMLQLGQQQGQLFGIYMKAVVPEVPEFDDSDKRQQWQFLNCRAQGSLDDEIYVAFG